MPMITSTTQPFKTKVTTIKKQFKQVSKTTTKSTTKIKKKATKSKTTKLTTSTSTSGIMSKISSTTSTSINITDLALKLSVQIYMESVFRRLNNFERLMDLKMDKFNEKTSSVDAKPRLVFLMTYEDLIRMYEERQKKKQTMKHITSGFKLTATIALLSLCLYLVYALYSFKIIMEQSYMKRKAAKEKRKRRARKKKKRQVLSKL